MSYVAREISPLGDRRLEASSLENYHRRNNRSEFESRVARMRILITGSRDWEDRYLILNVLIGLPRELDDSRTVLVSGGCPTGADKYAEDVAQWLGWQIERHPADWTTHGKAAGPIRNKQMVDSGPDICLAFIKDNSKGASGTATMAEKAGIKTLRFTA